MNDYDVKLIREVYEVSRCSSKGKNEIQDVIENNYNMDLDLVRELYDVVLNNSSDFYQFGICRSIRNLYPEAFVGILESKPFQSIPSIRS